MTPATGWHDDSVQRPVLRAARCMLLLSARPLLMYTRAARPGGWGRGWGGGGGCFSCLEVPCGVPSKRANNISEAAKQCTCQQQQQQRA